MNRVYPTQIFLKNKEYSNFAEQSVLDAKIAQRDGLVNELSYAKMICDQANQKVSDLENKKVGTLVGAVPYCTLHPSECANERSGRDSYCSKYATMNDSYGPRIAALTSEINALLEKAQAEAKIASSEAGLTPAQRQELERKRRELQAKIDLEKQKEQNILELAKLKTKKTIIVIISSILILGIIVGVTLYIRKKKI